MGKDVNKRKGMKRARVITELCVSIAILAVGGFMVRGAVKRSHPVGISPYVETSSSPDDLIDATEAIDPNKIIFESAPITTKDKFKGNLMLVNNQQQYFTGNENLINLNEKINEEGRTSYVGNDNDMRIVDVMYTPLSDMLDAFNAATGIDDIVIIGGYRTTERQQELYDEDLEATGNETSDRVALPGHSEHESGYAVDFTTSTTWDYDGTGEYDWMNQNCWKYGFILRYQEDKIPVTQIKFEPWHYRYVGVPHAYYMYKNNICLEEYIDLLRNYTYEDEHLKFNDDNGTGYEVYFVPSDDGAETTYVPVPSTLKYDISGNNVDGFIITVYTEMTVEPGQQNTVEDETSPADEGGETTPDDSQEISEDSDEE